eukprot:TRINITY_DN9013_c0_g1_i1.p1 TRINITY_DN9013_c0_g1~~TRINITY_DN9013_c0_g1_i1.p1  ORF type:complete len:434 (+),score=110.34 TRINITY_DN9013_c0_g1_i1:83-1384(+)
MRRAINRTAALGRRARSVAVEADHVQVDGIPGVLTSTFLHDNRPEWFCEQSRQRVSAAYGQEKDALRPAIKAAEVVNGQLCVEWAVQHPAKPDAPQSRFDVTWLEAIAAAPDGQAGIAEARSAEPMAFEPGVVPWSLESYASKDGVVELSDLPGVDYTAAMTTDEGCLAWLETLHTYGFGILRDGPNTKDEFDVELVAKKTANYVRESVYGGVWEFGVSEPLAEDAWDHADTAYGTDKLPLHTDGCYSYDPPGLQMLHCVEYQAIGGLSVLADGAHVLKQLQAADPEAFHTLTQHAFDFSYFDKDNGHYLRNTTPPIVLDPFTKRFKQIRLNDCDRDPFHPTTPAAVYEAWNALQYHANTATASVKFLLQPGQILVFDNWRCLHARSSFRGKRILKGCYMNREDFASRLRLLRWRSTNEPPPFMPPPICPAQA